MIRRNPRDRAEPDTPLDEAKPAARRYGRLVVLLMLLVVIAVGYSWLQWIDSEVSKAIGDKKIGPDQIEDCEYDDWDEIQEARLARVEADPQNPAQRRMVEAIRATNRLTRWRVVETFTDTDGIRETSTTSFDGETAKTQTGDEEWVATAGGAFERVPDSPIWIQVCDSPVFPEFLAFGNFVNRTDVCFSSEGHVIRADLICTPGYRGRMTIEMRVVAGVIREYHTRIVSTDGGTTNAIATIEPIEDDSIETPPIWRVAPKWLIKRNLEESQPESLG